MKEKEIVKEIELTEYQIELVNQVDAECEEADKAVGRVLMEYGVLRAHKRRGAWDDLARLAGYESLREMHERGMSLELSYLQRCLRVYKRVDGAQSPSAGE